MDYICGVLLDIKESTVLNVNFLNIFLYINRPEDQGLISGRVIPKTQKMVLVAALLNTQHNKVCIKGKVEQSRQRNRAVPHTSV